MKRYFFAGVVCVVMAIPVAFGMESQHSQAEESQETHQNSKSSEVKSELPYGSFTFTQLDNFMCSSGDTIEILQINDYLKFPGKKTENYEIPRTGFETSPSLELSLSLHHHTASRPDALLNWHIPLGQSFHFATVGSKIYLWIALDKKSQVAGKDHNNTTVSWEFPHNWTKEEFKSSQENLTKDMHLEAVQFYCEKAGFIIKGYRNHGSDRIDFTSLPCIEKKD